MTIRLIRHRRLTRSASFILMVISVYFIGAGIAHAATQDDFFNDATLQDVHLSLNATDWQTLKERDDENTYYPADLTLEQRHRPKRRHPVARQGHEKRHQARTARRHQPVHFEPAVFGHEGRDPRQRVQRFNADPRDGHDEDVCADEPVSASRGAHPSLRQQRIRRRLHRRRVARSDVHLARVRPARGGDRERRLSVRIRTPERLQHGVPRPRPPGLCPHVPPANPRDRFARQCCSSPSRN